MDTFTFSLTIFGLVVSLFATFLSIFKMLEKKKAEDALIMRYRMNKEDLSALIKKMELIKNQYQSQESQIHDEKKVEDLLLEAKSHMEKEVNGLGNNYKRVLLQSLNQPCTSGSIAYTEKLLTEIQEAK